MFLNALCHVLDYLDQFKAVKENLLRGVDFVTEGYLVGGSVYVIYEHLVVSGCLNLDGDKQLTSQN